MIDTIAVWLERIAYAYVIGYAIVGAAVFIGRRWPRKATTTEPAQRRCRNDEGHEWVHVRSQDSAMCLHCDEVRQ